MNGLCFIIFAFHRPKPREWQAAPTEEDDQNKWNWISAGAQVVPGQRVTGKIKEGMSQLSKQEWLGIWVGICIWWRDRAPCLLDFSLTANLPKFDSRAWPKVPLLLQTTCPPSRSRLSGGRRCSVMLRWFSNSEEISVFFHILIFKVNTDEEPMVFKAQLMALTGVQVTSLLFFLDFYN